MQLLVIIRIMILAKRASKPLVRFEAVKIEPLFAVLDAVAWLDGPTAKHIAEFANIEPRTDGKILKNARLIGLLASLDGATYVLAQPYPYKGTADEKRKATRTTGASGSVTGAWCTSSTTGRDALLSRGLLTGARSTREPLNYSSRCVPRYQFASADSARAAANTSGMAYHQRLCASCWTLLCGTRFL
jgi:hypothetical protein